MLRMSECLAVLELGQTATAEQVKQAYRRLARRYHPDLHHGDEQARRQFVRISTAYQMLLRRMHGLQQGRQVGHCQQCGAFDEVCRGVDGWLYCNHCLLSPRHQRSLPLPNFTTVRCLGSALLLMASIYLLVMAMVTGGAGYALAALMVGLVSMSLLAYTCLTVVFCLSRREKKLLAETTPAAIPDDYAIILNSPPVMRA